MGGYLEPRILLFLEIQFSTANTLCFGLSCVKNDSLSSLPVFGDSSMCSFALCCLFQ